MNAETQAVKSQDTAPEIKEQAEPTTVQEETKTQTFSQQDLDKIVAERVQRERAKYEKKYGSIDVDHYQKLIEKEEKARQIELEKRGQFEQLLKEQAEKFTSKIQPHYVNTCLFIPRQTKILPLIIIIMSRLLRVLALVWGASWLFIWQRWAATWRSLISTRRNWHRPKNCSSVMISK